MSDRNAAAVSSVYAQRHAERARVWKAPRNGGYSAVVPEGFMRPAPPTGPGPVARRKP